MEYGKTHLQKVCYEATVLNWFVPCAVDCVLKDPEHIGNNLQILLPAYENIC